MEEELKARILTAQRNYEFWSWCMDRTGGASQVYDKLRQAREEFGTLLSIAQHLRNKPLDRMPTP